MHYAKTQYYCYYIDFFQVDEVKLQIENLRIIIIFKTITIHEKDIGKL